MVFGKIDYLNLLPFYVFLKRQLKGSAAKLSLSKKSAYPSLVNQWFAAKRIDFAVISSIESFKYPSYKTLDFGVVAQQEVLSVLIKIGKHQADKASASSNMLALVLGLQGQVSIGNNALKTYAQIIENKKAIHHETYVDLAEAWREQTGLPFVFARLCTHKHHKKLEAMMKQFFKAKVKISHKAIVDYAKKLDIPKSLVHLYLSKISYKIGIREQRALAKFQHLVRRHARQR